MNNPILDNRNAKQIEQQIKRLAEQYVPEWNYNEEDPDVGVVFSKIYSQMMEDTLTKFNRVPYNNYITFLNMLGAKLSPSISSTGMISVDVVDGSKGVYIEKGSSLYASADNDKGRVFFETEDAMYAIDTKINSIYTTDGKNDSIVKLYDAEDSEDMKPFHVFSSKGYENLQSHAVYFEDNTIFNTKDKSDITFEFRDKKSQKNDAALSSIFFDHKNVIWQYMKDGTWVNIKNVEKTDKGIRLIFDDGIESSVIHDLESRYIRCLFKKIPKGGLSLSDVSYSAKAEDVRPDSLILDTSELSSTNFFPFGEQYTVYSDFYISSSEAFVKSGSKIDIKIDMQFISVKVNAQEVPDNTKYKYVMSEIDFNEPDPADIEIEKVVWEYWNGVGWAKLYKDNSNEDFFRMNSQNSSEPGRRVLSFTCPDDMKSIVIGPNESYFIRARINRVKNQFNVLGNYITPFIGNISIDYKYDDAGHECERLFVQSNMDYKEVRLQELDSKVLLKKEICSSPAMYFHLNKPIEGGPVRILFDIESGLYKDLPSVKWEYCAVDKQGDIAWQNIDIIDMTENFSHSAIVSLVGKKNFAKVKLFGKEGYFLRAINHDNGYDAPKAAHPIINGIHFNTVSVVQRESHDPEYFSIDNIEADKVCNLSSSNISGVEVWVNEIGSLTTKEEEMFQKEDEDSVIKKYNDYGNLSELWVKWKPIHSISCAKMGERVFEIDYNAGQIKFGNGKFGKIPTHQEKESIMIKYNVSEGSVGNIDAGKIQGFANAIPYVRNIRNLKPMVGGVDMETVENASKRVAASISGMDRIVTMDDIEKAVKYNDRNIFDVKCMAHISQTGEEEEGAVSIAVLPRDYMQGYEKFDVIKKRIEEFIKSKAPLTLTGSSKIKVFEATYVEISVNLDVVIDDYNLYQQVYQSIYNKLEKFLNPITGNFDSHGWKIGALPRKEIIYNYIKTTKNLKWIKSVTIFTKIVTADGKKEIDFENIKDQYFTVPVFGEPEINMSIN